MYKLFVFLSSKALTQMSTVGLSTVYSFTKRRNKPGLSGLIKFPIICRVYRIRRLCFLISCAIIVVFSTRIYRNLDLGIEWVLRC